MPHTDSLLARILEKRCLTTCFQPLVSVKKRALLALEALSRGGDEQAGAIPPDTLFSLPRSLDQRLALDRLCREKALERFAPLHKARRDLLLTLNIDASIIGPRVTGSRHLEKAVAAQGIDPNNVVIEVIESKVADVDSLIAFTEHYRAAGFLIALDDVGAGHSNLDRIPLMRPDMIKIDRGLIRDIDAEYHKREIAASLVRLCTKIGALCVAEGIETRAEVMTLLEMGVDVFQGFYFARPELLNGGPPDVDRRVREVAEGFARHRMRAFREEKQRHRSYRETAEAVVESFGSARQGAFDTLLAEAIGLHPDLECAYVLDADGIQISSTICDPERLHPNKRFIYQPAALGADHSLKDYFLPVAAGLSRFTTDPYISLASGNLCRTLAAAFTDLDGRVRVLCLDMSSD